MSPRHGREHLTYPLVLKLPVLKGEIQSKCFKCFYLKYRKFNKLCTYFLVQKPNILIIIGTAKRTDNYFKLLLIAIVKKELQENIKFKITISLRKLLLNSGKETSHQSYSDIADTAEIRKATVSDTFNAKSIPSSSTLILILKAMGISFNDFENMFDTIQDSDILAFKRGQI